MLTLQTAFRIGTITLNDPSRRNALSIEMFDAIEDAISQLQDDRDVRAIILRGEGKAFCAGFDLSACVEDPSHMATFIRRLSSIMQSIRHLHTPVVAAVHGAAIAGGCAILSACDFVVAETDSKLGYPVHRIGVSPAVTLPLLTACVGHGPARALVMSGELIDGAHAARIGLVTECVRGVAETHDRAWALADSLASKPPNALATTRGLLNQLDGSLDDVAFEETSSASASLATKDEAITLLREVWSKR